MRVAGSATEFIQTSQYLAMSVDMTLKEFQILPFNCSIERVSGRH